MPFSSRELAVHCAWVVDQKGGDQVRVLELPPQGGHAVDFAVLVTAGSDRLTNALVEEVWMWCKAHGVPRHPVEGDAGWMLIDCLDVVVHALSAEKREFYALDELWRTAKEVDWAAERKRLGDPDKPAKAIAVDPVIPREPVADATDAGTTEAAPKRAKKALRKATTPRVQDEANLASAERDLAATAAKRVRKQRAAAASGRSKPPVAKAKAKAKTKTAGTKAGGTKAAATKPGAKAAAPDYTANPIRIRAKARKTATEE